MFNVGDRVRLIDGLALNGDIKALGDVIGIKFGFVYTVKEDGGFLLKLEETNDFWMIDRFELAEEAVPEPEPVFEPTAFLFIQEAKPGGARPANLIKPFVMARTLELSWHQTLEEAELRRIQLTNGHNDNVHMYVRVEE